MKGLKMKNKRLIFIVIVFITISCNFTYAQIGVQTDNPDASAVLDIVSSDKDRHR